MQGNSLSQWQEIANTACFAIDQKLKSQAENHFHMFFQNPNISVITQLLQKGSDTLLFVLFSYINKNAHVISQDLRFFQIIVGHIRSWRMVGYSFQKDSHKVLENYVAKTIMLALGKLMKCLYENEETSGEMIRYLQNLPNEYFKLYLFKNFIDSVETIDTEMGYLKYRTMVYSFQDGVIPLICDILMPYFNNIDEQVHVSELTQFQQNLQVNESETSDRGPLDIKKQLEIEIEYVFMLLGRVLEFNYNITYTEYESQQVIDTCLITFPDKVIEKILNSQFLKAVFFLIEKVGEIKQGSDKQLYMKRGLECLMKLMQARLTYISQQAKDKYILHAIIGLTHLLNKCKEVGSEQLIEGIFLCNKKLFINTELISIKKIIQKDPLYKNSQLYFHYLQDLTQTIINVVSNSVVNFENNILSQALELANKLLMSYGQPDNQNMDDEGNFFNQFVIQIINGYLPKLCQSTCLLSTKKVTSVSQAKNNLTGLFQHFKKIASYNYFHFFNALLKAIQYSRNNNHFISLANILFLVCELVDHNYLERNPFLNRAKDTEMIILSQICTTCSQIIKDYQQIQIINNNSYDSYFSLAIILFCESLLNQFLTDYENNTTVKFQIKKKLYLMMVLGQRFSDPNVIDQQSIPTILTYLNILFRYLSSGEQALTLHILDVIERCIFKLKWNMKRQNFIKSQFFGYFCQYFSTITLQNNISIPLELRSRVAKIVVTLTFDDILDQYRFRIGKFIQILKRQNISIIFYDLIGVFEGLQTNAISRYFCRKMESQINLKELFDSIYVFVEQKNDETTYKDLIKLCRLIILNRGLKINHNPVSYKLTTLLLPYITAILKKICEQPDIDFWSQTIQQCMELMSGIINGTHINIFVLEKHTQQFQRGSFLIFFQHFLRILLQVQQSVRQYPKLEELLQQIMNNSNKQMLDYIYRSPFETLSHLYHKLLIGIMKLNLEYISLYQGGNKLIEDRLIKGTDCLRTYYSFFNIKRQIQHQQKVIQQLGQFYTMTENGGNQSNFNLHLIFTYISFVLANQNNSVFIRSIGKLLYELSKCFERHILESFSGVGLSADKLEALHNLFKNRECQQSFLMDFKEWLAKLSSKK